MKVEDFTVEQQLEAWSWCIGISAELNRKITSPFRRDKKAGCFLTLYYNSPKCVLFIDNAKMHGHGFTIAHAVAYIKHFYRDNKLDLNKSLCYIAYHLDFGKKPNLCPVPVVPSVKISNEEIETKILFIENNGYTSEDIKYWSSRGISSAQLKDNSRGGCVYSVYYYTVKGYTFEAKGLCFAYTIGDKVKIYQPFNVKHKWTSNVKKNDYWHTKRGKNKLFIAKAQKDHLIAENVFPDYDIISFMNEVTFPDNMQDILSQYSECVAVYDNDEAGLNGLKMLHKYGVTTYVVANKYCKDMDDVVIKNEKLTFKLIS